ncbi:protein phosphatase 2C domain-containing protein [Streptomyces sp. NBC_01387]|uniref:MerR family transcriptional regulator n=1 Tax=unclassified Streptomyces TaxID=2593676 RepID=UPI00224F3E8F|nr:MerR family transcriptional regulator [Streptomyces sp. NBC_01500]MCX4553436.1 protein phosphatase 2C domain-containing protein [Streptomyces sp. NBC_01500]WSV52437.1 protein phosphatase 2C domain-containing protein [Streptomyces sp. NBC_01014]
MELLTIGAFARASRLSPKALRLYDGLGLLTPVRVDEMTGYRFYAPEQLERARLVAWLRRLGMPLARIRDVCELEAPEAAGAVRAFWAQTEADIAARRDLATFLVDHLSWKEPAMSDLTQPLGIRYAALSDTGRVRASNQDTAYAGSRLLAVADGFGGGGAHAAEAAVDVLKSLETDTVPAGALLNTLEEAVERARQAVRGIATAGPASDEVGTTLTAMLWTGSQLALVHIGDSRAYLLRDGEFFQITHDHTLVQSMLDEGRISPEEASSHPQRSLLVRALSGEPGANPDMRLHDARPGDRYLLCSDGLSAVVPSEEIGEVLAAVGDPDVAVRELITLANRSGGPDNISCVVADVLELQA